LLDTDSKKDKLLLKMFNFAWENRIGLRAWVILENHYHILFRVSEGRTLSSYISKIHRGFPYEMNESEGKRERHLWQNYWDWCTRDENDYWNHFNYIHNNLIKHGVVRNKDSLSKYRYCSYWNYYRIKGHKWLMDTMEAYPIVDFTVENDE